MYIKRLCDYNLNIKLYQALFADIPSDAIFVAVKENYIKT